MRKTIQLCLQNIKSIFLSMALKHTEAGPRSSGTPFLVQFDYTVRYLIRYLFVYDAAPL